MERTYIYMREGRGNCFIRHHNVNHGISYDPAVVTLVIPNSCPQMDTIRTQYEANIRPGTTIFQSHTHLTM